MPYALIVLATFALYCWFCAPLIADYFPTTDDIAIEAASTPVGGPIHPSAWFTQGFGDYFDPYEEWGVRPSNFFRPLCNALFRAYYGLFGTHWADRLVVGYLAHALVVALSAYLALAVFGASLRLAALSTLIAVFNPALWGLYPDTFAIPPVLQFPVYQSEILCAGLMLVAVLAFIRRQFVVFMIVATTGLLLKETALTLPIAALCVTGVWVSRERGATLRHFLCLIAPLCIWLLIKLTIFRNGFTSFVMTSSKPLSWLTHPLRNTLLWPTGLYTSTLRDTASAVQLHDWSSLLGNALELAINTLWWLAIALVVVVALRRSLHMWLREAPDPCLTGLVFAGTNLLLLVALQESHVRYGYLWFALGPAPIMVLLSRHRGGLTASVALALGLTLPLIRPILDVRSADSIRDYRLVKGAARQLTSLLGSLPQGVKQVYLIDDVAVQIPSPKYMAKFSGFDGRLLLVNSIRPVPHCRAAAPLADRYRLTRAQDTTSLQYRSPDCFEPYFGLPPLESIGADRQVARGPWMSYEYPELSPASSSATAPYGTGRNWRVSSRDPVCAVRGACTWIGFDEQQGRYYQLDDQAFD